MHKAQRKIDKIVAKLKDQSTHNREFETKIRLLDERSKTFQEQIDGIKGYTVETDRYLALFAPMNVLNQITDVLHHTLDGYYFNRLIQYEKDKYQDLENAIKGND